MKLGMQWRRLAQVWVRGSKIGGNELIARDS
jgi:glutaredoxin-related protein